MQVGQAFFTVEHLQANNKEPVNSARRACIIISRVVICGIWVCKIINFFIYLGSHLAVFHPFAYLVGNTQPYTDVTNRSYTLLEPNLFLDGDILYAQGVE